MIDFHAGEEDAVRTDPRKLEYSIAETKAQRKCSLRVRATATILPAKDFQAHLVAQRFERKPLLSKGVEQVLKLPPSRVEMASGGIVSELERLRAEESDAEEASEDAMDDAMNQLAATIGQGPGGETPEEEASVTSSAKRNAWLEGCRLPSQAIELMEEQTEDDIAELATLWAVTKLLMVPSRFIFFLCVANRVWTDRGVVTTQAILPSFPECIWDPRTDELTIDETQLKWVVDENRSLADCVKEYEEKLEKRLGGLEQGGLLTGRTLAEFSRRHLDPAIAAKIAKDADLPEEALMKVMKEEGGTAGMAVVRRSKSMYGQVDLMARSKARAKVGSN